MKKEIDSFKIVGISIRTTNENMQATTDIPALWSKFFADNISAKIPDKMTDELYCVYTDYEKDHTKPYTTILGHKVKSCMIIPEGLVEKHIEAQEYEVITASGKQSENFVYKAWLEIWNSKLDRSYTSDFEVYGAESQNPENAQVNIHIAVN